ncbi:MAG TPA: response regulator transcription factor [Cytophagaceae bacterium]|jgi:DNA-binding response OmpR family regulator|nr:response regulator transcription factor [Cytophagaceae bacterium]
MNILLIEDDVKISSYIKKGLEEYGSKVTIAYDGFIGKRLAISNLYDLIILDIVLPVINGFDLCTQIRGENIKSPILLLSALASTEDRVYGLDAGGDDYLVKPFEFRELVAKVNALSRRSSSTNEQTAVVLKIGTLEMNVNTRVVKSNNVVKEMTSKEFSLLEFLLINKERIVTRAEIAEHVWDGNVKNTNVIDVYINFLRKKLEQESGQRLIHTIVGMGYILRAPLNDEN